MTRNASRVLSALVAALVAAWVPCALAGDSEVRVVTETNGSITVEFSRPTAGVVGVGRFFVAVGDSGTPSTSVTGLPAGSVRLTGPIVYRGTRLFYVEAAPILAGSGGPLPRVTITWPPAPAVHDASRADPLVRHLVVNRSVFPSHAAVERTDPFFARASRWVRVTIPAAGLYALTGADLQGCGVDPLTIGNPGTIRAFTLNGAQLDEAFDDTMATWQAGHAMREIPVQVRDGGDGVFNVGDRIVFYALAPSDWADRFDPSAPDTVYRRHPRNQPGVVYVTWDAALPGSPRRPAVRDAAPVGGAARTTARRRAYRERDLFADFDYRGDGWLWLSVVDTRVLTLDAVDVTDLVPSVPQTFRTIALSDAPGATHEVEYSVSNAAGVSSVGTFTWTGQQFRQEFGVPVRIDGSFLAEGTNTFRYRMTRRLNPTDRTRFAWFSVSWEARLVAHGGRIDFGTPDTAAVYDVEVRGLPAAGEVVAWDVTDPYAPEILASVVLSPDGTGRRARLSTGRPGRRRFVVSTLSALRRPATVSCVPLRDLRAEAGTVNMVIIVPAAMRAAADALASWRRTRLPGFDRPVVRVVPIESIWENFSGGLVDPWAIRNYLRFLYDNHRDAEGDPTLAYVLLLGDATEDWNRNASALPDLVPTLLDLRPLRSFTYVTDQRFALLDDADIVAGRAVQDVALGRIPAGSLEEAMAAVQRVIAYEASAEREAWRQRVVLVADDELSSFPTCETAWTDQSEALAFVHGSELFDVRKVYLTEYPEVSGIKPASRAALLDEWNRGALAINYIGHGSNRQMADEQVFVDTDVSLLENGLRRPIITALSCTIGEFANPSERSLTEKLLFREEGGIIAAITASRESFASENNVLNNAIYRHLAPRRPGGEVVAAGTAAIEAQIESLAAARLRVTQQENNHKYNFFGDPAMRLNVPRLAVRFDAAPGDSLVAGLRTTIGGGVYRDGVLDTGFSGVVRVRVQEPMVHRTYETRCASKIRMRYRLPGGTVYDGTTDVVAGRFAVSFRVPRVAATGSQAVVSAYAWNAVTDAAANEDSLFELTAPTLADSAALAPVDGPPRVELGFAGGRTQVKPGATVRALVRDGDGIDMLETTNEGRQAILIDELPVPIEVNAFFRLEHGGVDTAGVLEYPLPELERGPHRLVYKVADSFGQITLDTLRFEVIGELEYRADVPLAWPNPFREATQFLVRTSDPAFVSIDVFTVSGRRVRRLEAHVDGGDSWVRWDGRDAVGDRVANGTYLYVARIRFDGVRRPETVVRGAIARAR